MGRSCRRNRYNTFQESFQGVQFILWYRSTNLIRAKWFRYNLYIRAGLTVGHVCDPEGDGWRQCSATPIPSPFPFTTISQYYNITIPQYHNATPIPSPFRFTTIPQYYNITIPQYHNGTPSPFPLPQYQNTTMPEYQNTTPTPSPFPFTIVDHPTQLICI